MKTHDRLGRFEGNSANRFAISLAISAALIGGSLAGAPARAAAPPSQKDFAGRVDIGGGREIYLECRGAGAPTVVLISGKGNGAADWRQVLDPADPAPGAAYDLVGAGQGRLFESEAAVFPSVARFTRVCAYDRPGARTGGAEISTPVVQPHSAGQAVGDLAAMLASAGETGPYVIVAHSYGGLIASLFARQHPAEVAGLVMVDAASERMKDVLGPEKLAAWDAANRASTPAAPEAVEVADAIARIEAAPPPPRRPAVVLSADKPWSAAPADAQGAVADGATVTFADWLAAQDLLAASLGARHVTQTRSGHNVYLYAPQLVIDAIREVVEAARRNGSAGEFSALPTASGVAPAMPLATSPVQNSWAAICGPGAWIGPITIHFQLDASGRLVGEPRSSERDTTDPAIKAASDRAIGAVLKAAPTYVRMTQLHGKSFAVVFDPRPLCATKR